MSVLKMELKPGESILIGDDIVLTLEKKSGQRARLSFNADNKVSIRKSGRNAIMAYIAKHGLEKLKR